MRDFLYRSGVAGTGLQTVLGFKACFVLKYLAIIYIVAKIKTFFLIGEDLI